MNRYTPVAIFTGIIRMVSTYVERFTVAYPKLTAGILTGILLALIALAVPLIGTGLALVTLLTSITVGVNQERH